MMTGFVDGIFSIGVVLPDLVGKKFELSVVRPVIKAVVGDSFFTVNFLQEHHVCIYLSQRIFNVMQDKTQVAGAESFMDIISQDFE